MKDLKNIHEGHRQRFREQIDSTPIESLTPLHYLEYILTFTIPRADTNPIAHRLLNRFKYVDQILNKDPKILQTIEGVGPKTAEFIHALYLTSYMFNKSKAQQNPVVDNLKTAISFFQNILPPSENEQFIALILDKNYQIKNYKIFHGTSHSKMIINNNEFCNFLITNQASFMIFAHTHPKHNAKPSDADVDMIREIKNLLHSLSIVLLENIVLGEVEFCSFKQNYIRTYSELATNFSLSQPFVLEELNFDKIGPFSTGD